MNHAVKHKILKEYMKSKTMQMEIWKLASPMHNIKIFDKIMEIFMDAYSSENFNEVKKLILQMDFKKEKPSQIIFYPDFIDFLMRLLFFDDYIMLIDLYNDMHDSDKSMQLFFELLNELNGSD